MTTTPKRRRIGAVTLIFGAILMAMGFFAPSAAADHVEPTAYEGNPGCAADEIEFKINAQPENGDYTESDAVVVEPEGMSLPAGFTITISNVTVDDEGDEKSVTFDWAASSDDGDELVDYVLVKWGDGGLKYDYLPDGATEDTGLGSTADSISHVTFCLGGATGGTDGTTDDTTTDDGTTDDTTTDDGGTDQVLGTDSVNPTDGPTDDGTTDEDDVQGNVVLPKQLPRTGDNDQSLFLIGMGLIVIGAVVMIARRELFVRS